MGPRTAPVHGTAIVQRRAAAEQYTIRTRIRQAPRAHNTRRTQDIKRRAAPTTEARPTRTPRTVTTRVVKIIPKNIATATAYLDDVDVSIGAAPVGEDLWNDVRVRLYGCLQALRHDAVKDVAAPNGVCAARTGVVQDDVLLHNTQAKDGLSGEQWT